MERRCHGPRLPLGSPRSRRARASPRRWRSRFSRSSRSSGAIPGSARPLWAPARGLRRAVTGRRVLQVYDYTVREKPDTSDLNGVPHCWQPAVIRHPVTGRSALYVDRLMSAAIEGMAREESDALLEQLFPYVERADYEHVWRPGDYVIWDNRCSVHARTDFPATERRLLKRGKVAGEALIAAT